MGNEQKPKRPRPAKRRTLPRDAMSLCEMIRSLTRQIHGRSEHLKCEPHDYRNRRGFAELYDQRAAAFEALWGINPVAASELLQQMDLTCSTEVA